MLHLSNIGMTLDKQRLAKQWIRLLIILQMFCIKSNKRYSMDQINRHYLANHYLLR